MLTKKKKKKGIREIYQRIGNSDSGMETDGTDCIGGEGVLSAYRMDSRPVIGQTNFHNRTDG